MLFSLITVESAMLSQVSPENAGVTGKEPPCPMQVDVRFVGWIPKSGRSREEGIATHSSILA